MLYLDITNLESNIWSLMFLKTLWSRHTDKKLRTVLCRDQLWYSQVMEESRNCNFCYCFGLIKRDTIDIKAKDKRSVTLLYFTWNFIFFFQSPLFEMRGCSMDNGDVQKTFSTWTKKLKAILCAISSIQYILYLLFTVWRVRHPLIGKHANL